MITIPLQAVPAQSLNITLAGQPCAISVYQKTAGVFLDLSVNGVAIVSARLCRNATLIVRDAYRGFVGDLVFGDAMGSSDPDYTGFGARFALVYLEASDL